MLIYPLVIVTHLIRFIAGYHKPVYESTIEGDPLKYSGDLPLLIAVWSEDASVWTVATADVVQQLKQEFVGRCEFVYVEASSKSVTEMYDAEIVPVLILYTEAKRLNGLSIRWSWTKFAPQSQQLRTDECSKGNRSVEHQSQELRLL